jgi:hypothetical protein
MVGADGLAMVGTGNCALDGRLSLDGQAGFGGFSGSLPRAVRRAQRQAQAKPTGHPNL